MSEQGSGVEKKVLRQSGYWSGLPVFICETMPTRDIYVPQDFGGIAIGAARPFVWMTPTAAASMRGDPRFSETAPEVAPVYASAPPQRRSSWWTRLTSWAAS